MTPREQLSVLIFLLLIFVVAGVEVWLLGWSVANKLRRRRVRRVLLARRAIVLHVLVAVMVVCMLYGFLVEPRWIETTFVTLHTPKLKDTSFRIVQISDLHCDTTGRSEARAVQIINALKPDIVVATGDYLNDASALGLLRNTLRGLQAPLGVFAVTGNFESSHWSHLDLFAWTDVHLLRQSTVTLTKGDESITLSGLDIDRAAACWDLLADLPRERFNVFLYHKPDLIEAVCHLPVDLYLCGHTHGGQVALPFYGALVTFSKFGKKYESGRYRVGDTVLYVNRGLGLEPRPAPQVRFLARPEISVFDIHPE
ncbi:MAG: metallophosphoesterase [Sedimentisphaerales bacterium]|nr:metallophosphoesterase [Sedimentisphaerales bacterium]